MNFEMNELEKNCLPNLNLGDIRILTADPDYVNFEYSAKLVVVLHDHRKIDGTLTIMYVDKLIEIATDRDFIVSKQESGMDFDSVIWPDFTIRVKESQLIEGPTLGEIDVQVLKNIENMAEIIQDRSFFDFKDTFHWQVGQYIPIHGDKVWLRRSLLMDELNLFAVVEDENATMLRYLQIHEKMNENIQNKPIEINSKADVKILLEFNPDFARAAILV